MEPVDAEEEKALPGIVQTVKVEFDDEGYTVPVEVAVDLTNVKREIDDDQDFKVKEAEPQSTVKEELWTDDNIPTISMQYNKRKGLDLTEDLSFTCDYCNRSFKKRSSLFTHICRIHSKMTYKCNICNKIFKCEPYLLHHIATVHSGVEYDCHVCGKVFHTEKSMRKHVRRVHSKANLECSVCQRKFKVKDHLAKHIAGKHGTERHQCEICKKVYRAKHLLKIHMKGIHEKQQATSENLRKCNICMRQFKCIIYLQRHKQRGNCHMKEIFQCNLCNIVFRNNGTLKRHTIRVHSSIRYKCDVCHKEFKMKDHLNHHMASMHGNEKHECKFCGKIFKAKQSMQKHVRCVHTLANKEPYQCSSCHREFKFISYLRRHQTRSNCTNSKKTMKTRRSKDIVVKKEPESIEIELNPEMFQNMEYSYEKIKEEPQSDGCE